MECKICKLEFKGKLGLSKHCRNKHNINILEYYIKYENLIWPICSCGEKLKYKDGIKFFKTCGNEKCSNNLRREFRLEYMKNNPEKTAWRLGNMSYPEKKFKEFVEYNNIDKNYLIIRERPVHPYYIDFAFENEKVAVEIDGSQHNNEEIKNRDLKKEKVLIKNGWRIFRITAKQILIDVNSILPELINFIGGSKTKDMFGVISNKELKEMLALEKNEISKRNGGKSPTQIENDIKQRIIERPTYESLLKDIKINGYSATGRKYGVSDNTIRKWVRYYEKYKK